jgi:hypothetical protein
VSKLSLDFIRQLARAVERMNGDMDDVHRLVATWEGQVNGNGAGLHGVLRTFEGEQLPRPTEELIIRTRPIFAEREEIGTRDLARALGLTIPKLKKLLEPSGISPIKGKPFRRGWFEGYYEQLDLAYTAPVRAIGDVAFGQLAGEFGATEIPAESVCKKATHTAHWRLAAGGPWQCTACHPPVPSLEVVFADG